MPFSPTRTLSLLLSLSVYLLLLPAACAAPFRQSVRRLCQCPGYWPRDWETARIGCMGSERLLKVRRGKLNKPAAAHNIYVCLCACVCLCVSVRDVCLYLDM